MTRRTERLYQLGFDDQFQTIRRYDVTPHQFAGLQFPHKPDLPRPQLGRLVREVPERVQIVSPEDAAAFFQKHIFVPWPEFDQEELHGLLCNTKNVPVYSVLMYRGTVNSTIVRVPEVFKEAVRVNAPALLIAHNHPSGDPTPSPEDVQLTQRIIDAGKLLDIELLDHLIIGDGRWVSLKQRGLAFK